MKSFNLHKKYFDKYYKETSFEYEFKNIPTLQILNDDDLKDLKNNEEEITSYGFKLEILNSNEEIIYYQPGISKEINISIIEKNIDQANILAEIFANISVINGDALDQDILTEAGISNAETFVSLTNNDEVNILSALLAKRSGAIRAVTLINKPNYIPLINTLGINSVISPAQITVSSILSKIRSGSIKSIHSIIEDKGEVLEARALELSLIHI